MRKSISKTTMEKFPHKHQQNEQATSERGAFYSGAYERYRQDVEKSVEHTKLKIINEFENREYVSLELDPFHRISEEVLTQIGKTTGLSGVLADVKEKIHLEIPPPKISADFALSIFSLAKKAEMPVAEVSRKLEESFNSKEYNFIGHAVAAGPFLNLELNQQRVYGEVISNIVMLGERYGESNINARKVAIIDYSAPNIAKPIGVGHLRSTVIGQALANIYEKTGFTIVKDNHLGDWGSQFGELIYAYQNWGNEEEIEKDPIRLLKDLYVKFHHEVQEHPEIKEKSRELFTDLEKGNPELLELWGKFRRLSLEDFEKTYKRLGVNFDMNIGESYFVNQSDSVIDESIEKGAAKIDTETGAVVVEGLGNLPSFLLRKQDGSSLYLTRDMATLNFRVKNFHPNTILYVVGSEQELNFRQLFELGEKVGYIEHDMDTKHIGFGMVLKDGKKMSTRRGTVVELEELLRESVEKSKKMLLEKNRGLSENEINDVSEIMGVGAVIYNDLRQSRTKDISFDWERMLNFETGSAVYLQYTYARIQSILGKVEAESSSIKDKEYSDGKHYSFENESEFRLAKKMMMFPSAIIQAQKEDAPHVVATYLEELAQLFNAFYQNVSILKTNEADLKKSRTELTRSVGVVIKNGLGLLGIKVPKQM